MDEEATHEENEVNELYRDVNINLEGRDTVMTDASLPNVHETQETEDTHVILTALIVLEDVPVTTIVEPPLVFGTTLPPPPTHLITHMQQIPFPIPTTAPSTFLQDLPNFSSLFSAFMMNRLNHPDWLSNLARLNVETMTPKLLAGLTFELMKGTCKSLVELEYFFKEVYKATIEQLDWHNPEGQQYPYDLRKPLPLIPNSRGRQVIPFDHFINNNLAYLCGGVSSRTYATYVTKTKAADYSHIKWIEELVPNAMESARDVYSRRRIIAITKLQIVEWHGYKHLDWITVRRDDDKLHTFKEGDFKRLRLQDIKDMLLLLVQGKLTNLNVEEQAYYAYSNRRGFIYQNKDKKNKLMRIDELHKFSDGTLDVVQTTLNDRLKGIMMEYLPKTIWR
ncbi:hypothetical protein Tco_1182354 [Tanacetum coccineum]